MVKVKKKKVSEKIKEKTGKSFDSIIKSLASEFSISVMNQDTIQDRPYNINFRHKGLQYITGGTAGGEMIEIHSQSGAGKSFLLYELGVDCIRQGGYFILFDVENAYKSKYGKRIGLEGNMRFIKSNERTIEKITALSKKIVREIRSIDKDAPILIGWDSYPPIQTRVSKEEIKDQDGEKSLKGYMQAKKNNIFSMFMGEFCDDLDVNKIDFVILNQTRQKMNVMFGDATTTNADSIIQFYATKRLRGKIIEHIKHKERKQKIIGMVTKWKTTKNRDRIPFMEALVQVDYKDGLVEYSGLIELLINEGKIIAIENTKPKQYKYGKIKFQKSQIEKLIEKYPELLEYEE